MTDEELLALVKLEREASLGFDQDPELVKARTKANSYYKGDVTDDLPPIKNRSKVTSSDVADAVDTVCADLQDIFSGGDDVATLAAQNEQDEEQAQKETDYLNHVFFQQNPGFLILASMIKDACMERTGIATWGWTEPEYEEQKFEGRSAVDMIMAQGQGEVLNAEPSETGYSFTLKRVKKPGRCWVDTIAPSDFTIAADAVSIEDATYCAMRARPRAQDLIADGIEKDVVDRLPPYAGAQNSAVQQSHDRAQESNNPPEGIKDLRTVEVFTHFLRIVEDGEAKLWKIRTGAEEGVLIDKEEVDRANFAAITPYIVTHRFYGESVADRMLEIQLITTALWRMQLDSGFFALNQRTVVDMTKAGDFTISDLIAQEPGRPVRAEGENAVVPLQSGGLSFPVLDTIEMAKVAGEGRTGIVRNAQGLNPDTLHDTARGALALMSAAQKRVRFIARVFAETGIKDLFLGLHACIRENEQGQVQAPLKGKWAQLSPGQWPERNDMTIHIGLGAAGRDHDVMAIEQISNFAEKLAQTPYGGELVTKKNAYNMGAKLVRSVGFKEPEEFFTEPDPNAPPQPPPPDPHMAKVQGELQLQQQDQQFSQQADMAKMQADKDKQTGQFQLDQMKAQQDAQIQREANAAKIELEREIAAQELQLKREQYAAELELKRWEIEQELELKRIGIVADTHVALDRNAQVNVGGDPG